MSSINKHPRIIVALDFPAAEPALELVSRLDPSLCRLKVGKEMFTRLGPAFVEQLVARGFYIFLDLKYHDIPNTVAGAIRAALPLNPFIVNVHAGGGRRMMEAAAKAADEATGKRPNVIGVTRRSP